MRYFLFFYKCSCLLRESVSKSLSLNGKEGQKMNFNQPNGIAAILMLASAAVFAADAHHDHPPAAAPAADHPAAPAKDAQAKDTAALAADDHGKPAPAKKARKQARAKPLHKAPTHGTKADTHADAHHPAPAAHGAHNASAAHGTPQVHEAQGSKRLRVKDRSAAAAHASDSTHAAHPSKDASHADASHAAPAAKAGHDAPAAHDGHHAPAAKDHPADHAAPSGKDSHGAHAAPAATATNSAKDSHADHHEAHATPAVHDSHATHADHHAAPEKASHAASAAEYCNPPLKSEVAALFDRWNASLRTGDPKKVAANYAPGSVLLPTVSNRARFTAAEKEDYFAHFLARRPEGTIDDRVIDVDCNSATDAGLYTFRFADGTAVKARYSFSYRKVGSQWLITSHHSSGMPEKAAVAAEHPVSGTAQAKPAERVEQGSPAKGWVRYP